MVIFDSASSSHLESKREEYERFGVEFRLGTERVGEMEAFEYAVLSPGIDSRSVLVRSFLERECELVGELEFAFKRCVCPVVAITGTNGKTTTTQLVDAMFNGAGVASVACGNIGPAFSREVHRSRDLDVMTVEVSSFQLETIRSFRPRIAVWLNFTPDHLDRYDSMEEYFEAKARIFENLAAEDWAVLNGRDELPKVSSRVLRFSAFERGFDFEWVDGAIWFRGQEVLPMSQTQLRGLHNAENLMAALGVGVAWGLRWEQMIPALCGYCALPHRCEVVTSVGGVEFVNDSKATNLDAMEKALSSEVRRVVLIAGGKDKGFDFGAVMGLVAERCRAAVLIGEMAPRIEDLWGSALPCYRALDLESAVVQAAKLARPGDVVLFSPGTSSFDMFKNYADRGNQFRSAVQKFSTHTLQPS